MNKTHSIIIISLLLAVLIVGGIYIKISFENNKPNININSNISGEVVSGDLYVSGDLQVIDINSTKEIICEKSGDSFSLILPDNWEYRLLTEQKNQFKYGIEFWHTNSENYVGLYEYTNFGVCGTGLTTNQALCNNGKNMDIGYYDGGDVWSFVFLGSGDKDVAAINHGLGKAEANEALEILKSVNY